MRNFASQLSILLHFYQRQLAANDTPPPKSITSGLQRNSTTF